MKIAVTGGCGKLGHHVCRELVNQGFDVLAVDAAYRNDLPCPIKIANLLDRTQCFDWLAGVEIVVHLGNRPGFFSIPYATGYAENVAMTANVFETARELGVKKIIYASSIQAMGGLDGRVPRPAPKPSLPLNGSEPANPENLYALSKAAGEQMLAYYAERYGLETVAIRFPFLYVEPPPPKNVANYMRTAEAGFSLCHTDAARLIAACVKSPLPGFRVYMPSQVENLFQISTQELLDTYAADFPLRKPREELHGFTDTSRITAETGWSPAPGITPITT